MQRFYHKKKVLITGHTGFKGAWLTQVLHGWGAQVVGLSLKPETRPNLFTILGHDKKIKNYFVDIRDFKKVKEVIAQERPEIIFHLAAQALVRTSYDDPVGTISTNVLGMANLLEAVREVKGVKSVVAITTDKVYENKEWHYAYRENEPLGGYDPYAASKAAADIVASSYIQSFFNEGTYKKKHHTLIAITRAGNVIGGGDWAEHRLIPDIVKAIFHKGKHVEIRNPEAVRPWQHVLEPLSGYLLLGKLLYEGKKEFIGPWNFGPNIESFVSVRELVEAGKTFLKQGGYVIKKDKHKRHEATFLKLDINKAVSLLKWKPILSFKETLRLTFEWYVCYYGKKEDIVAYTEKQIKNFFA